MIRLFSSLLLASALTFVHAPQSEAASGRVAARGSHGAFVAGSHNGNAHVRGWGVRQNADGSTTAARGGAFRLNNGAKGVRGATTTVNPDGSATRRSGFAATGSKGTITSEGSGTHAADGSISGTRNTGITAANGNSYSGTTSYDPATGLTHSGSCRDAAGNTISCPTR